MVPPDIQAVVEQQAYSASHVLTFGVAQVQLTMWFPGLARYYAVLIRFPRSRQCDFKLVGQELDQIF